MNASTQTHQNIQMKPWEGYLFTNLHYRNDCYGNGYYDKVCRRSYSYLLFQLILLFSEVTTLELIYPMLMQLLKKVVFLSTHTQISHYPTMLH